MKNFVLSYYSDIGTREKNEDSFSYIEKGNNAIFVVADGLGGHENGEIASSVCVKCIVDDFINNDNFELLEAINKANNVILKKQQELHQSMKTTVAVIVLDEDSITIGHIGDTRAYAIKENAILYQSMDHSVAQTAVLVGEITLEEIREHCDRNQLTQVLGIKSNLKVEIKKLKRKEIDSLLLCTDGFWEYVTEDMIINCKRLNVEQWLNNMKSKIPCEGHKDIDNNTAMVISVYNS